MKEKYEPPCSWCELESFCKSSGESCDNLKNWIEEKENEKENR